MADEVRLSAPTSVLHLEFMGNEDATVELLVLDGLGQGLPLASATARIGLPRCAVQHTWSVEAGNLRLGDVPGQLYISVTAAQTATWSRTWGDSEWQLDVIDIFGRHRVPCVGDVRVNPTLTPEQTPGS